MWAARRECGCSTTAMPRRRCWNRKHSVSERGRSLPPMATWNSNCLRLPWPGSIPARASGRSPVLQPCRNAIFGAVVSCHDMTSLLGFRGTRFAEEQKRTEGDSKNKRTVHSEHRLNADPIIEEAGPGIAQNRACTEIGRPEEGLAGRTPLARHFV